MIKVNAGLFVPLTHDVLCAACGRFTAAQWDDREQSVTVGWQFRWCPHELCWLCAGAVVEACPVCAVSGPVGLDLSRLTHEALDQPLREEPRPGQLWPLFLLASLLATGLMFWPQIRRLLW